MKLAGARCCGGTEQAGSCLPKRFHLLLCSRWLLGHFGQQDWKRAIICFLDGLPALVFGEFQVMRFPCPTRVILYAALLCHDVLVCFGSDLLPELLNTCELSVVTLLAVNRTTDGAGEARWAGQLFSNSPAAYKRTSTPCSGTGRRDGGVLPPYTPLVNLPLEKIIYIAI